MDLERQIKVKRVIRSDDVRPLYEDAFGMVERLFTSDCHEVVVGLTSVEISMDDRFVRAIVGIGGTGDDDGRIFQICRYEGLRKSRLSGSQIATQCNHGRVISAT